MKVWQDGDSAPFRGGGWPVELEEHPNQNGISEEAVPGRFEIQVGGLPRWVEIASHPQCTGCDSAMPFVASVSGGMTPLGRLPFEGVVFGFWCDACQISVSKFQA